MGDVLAWTILLGSLSIKTWESFQEWSRVSTGIKSQSGSSAKFMHKQQNPMGDRPTIRSRNLHFKSHIACILAQAASSDGRVQRVIIGTATVSPMQQQKHIREKSGDEACF